MPRPLEFIALLFLTYLLVGAAAAKLIDDFSTAYLNNLGGVRSGPGVSVMVTYPRLGIIIPNRWDYLFEEVAVNSEHLALGTKCLMMNYTAFSAGGRIIKHIETVPGAYTDLMTHEIKVPLEEGRHQVIIIPLAAFDLRNSGLGHSFGIGGPLIVHSLELVESAEYPDRVLPVSSIQNLYHTQNCNPYSFTSHQIESPPQLQFVEWVHHDFDPVGNRNSLHLLRDGRFINKIHNGLEIDHDGFLYENLVATAERIDMSNKMLRLTYSAKTDSLMTLKLLYHLDSVHDDQAPASLVEINVPKAYMKTRDIPFTQFPGFRILDAKGISILGPCTIHRIELIDQSGWLSQFLNYLTGSPEDVVLVDDLTEWPSAISPRPMVIEQANDLVVLQTNTLQSSGRNSLNFPCMSSGVSIAENGIRLSNHGFLFEQLSPLNGVLDLSSAYLEIEYSAEHQVTRQFSIHAVVGNNNFRVQPVLFDVLFSEGNRKSVRLSIRECGPSHAIHISGSGEIILHRIILHLSLPGHRDIVSTVAVDDFRDWPLAHSISNQAPTETGSQASVMFNYRSSILPGLPALHNCNYVLGQGLEVTDEGYISQSLPNNFGTEMKIQYSAVYPGTRKLVFLAKTERSGNEGQVMHRIIYVMFNAGQFQEATFPLPMISKETASFIGFRVHGPLILHQIEMSHEPQPVDILPGQSTADALLIDDFSNWTHTQADMNILSHGRYALGAAGLGFINLRGFDDYLVEGFSGFWDLSTMEFRITYTANFNTTCKMSLVSESLYDSELFIPTRPDNPILMDIAFTAGTMSRVTVSVGDLMEIHEFRFGPYYGVLIRGPLTNQPNLDQSLTLHRIELMRLVPYSLHITPRIGFVPPEENVSYEFKLSVFKRKLNLLRLPGLYAVSVSRAHVWKNASTIIDTNPRDLRRALRVNFDGERGQDAGGLRREFFTLMADAINNPAYNLFLTSADGNYALQINPNPLPDIPQSSLLREFRLIGRIIGIAVLNKSLLGVRLVPSLYKKLIKKPAEEPAGLPDLLEEADMDVDISDLKAIDEDIYASLNWCLCNNITDVLDLTMSLEWPQHKTTLQVDLVKNGRQHKVTESNKKQYVLEYARWHVERKVEAQANALRDGVWDIIPRVNLSVFNATELEMLIAGTSEIDIGDWMDNTEYLNGYTRNHPVIKLFWECVKGWGAEEHGKLLQFVTGSPRLPSSGFVGLEYKFTISRAEMEEDHFPTAATCFNKLSLPAYLTADIMHKQLNVAIQPETAGFAFA